MMFAAATRCHWVLMGALEGGEPELQRERVLVRQDRDQRPQEVVPGPQELDHRQRGERRQRERDDDPQQDRQPGCAVDPRGLLEVDRERPEELGEQEDAEDVDEVRHDERAEAVEEPEVLHDQERGDQHDLQRHHQGGQDHEVDERASEEPDPRERVRRERAQDQVARDDRDGHYGRVPEPSREGRVLGSRPGSSRTASVPGHRIGGKWKVCASVSSEVTTIQSNGSSITAASGSQEQVPGVERQQAPPRALDHPGLAGQRPRIRPGELDGCLGDRAHDE